MGLEEERACLN